MNPFKYKALRKKVTNSKGDTYPITQALVSRKPPRSGWSVFVEINGQVVTVTGFSPTSVVVSLCKILRFNSIEYAIEDVWLHCNKIWIDKTNPKYCMVTMNELLLVCAPSEEERKSVDLSILNSCFSLVEVYLASSSYTLSVLKMLVEVLCICADPDRSPESGDALSYKVLKSAEFLLDSDPPFRVDQARAWLYGLHVRMSREVFLRKPATEKEFYKNNNWR